ncbi:hypothetical protein GCM10010912_08650 [Paenibacillus albidus]|uniref:Uncharacterized protein n=1 Tax=Paenibacillus albidus TaxID=2041023 RepID=A0A917FBR8_9BACL|nr:hypothetical protein GCM10010912_08650 [Paenibacillus albidus]
MKPKNSKSFSFVMMTVFIIISIAQFIDGNTIVAIFPLICALVFAYKGLS